MPRLKDENLENTARSDKAAAGVGCDGFHSRAGLDMRNEAAGHHSVQGRGEWVEMNTTRVCVGLCSSFCPSRSKCGGGFRLEEGGWSELL